MLRATSSRRRPQPSRRSRSSSPSVRRRPPRPSPRVQPPSALASRPRSQRPPPPPMAPPDGSVQFLVNGLAYGSTVTLSGGTAQLAITEPAGSYTVAAQYTGDVNYAATLPAAETNATLTVNQAATATAVTPGTASVAFGQSATFTATVSSANGAPPDGSVQFLVNGLAYGSTVTLSGGTAQLAITEPAGSYTVAAQYTGDVNYAATLPAAETSATLTVNQAATATAVTPGTASVAFGQSATFTATVSSANGAPPDGSVQFLVNGAGLRQHGATERRHGAARDHRAGGQLHGRGAIHRRRQLCRDPAGRRDQCHPHRQSGGDRHGRHPGYSHRQLWPVGHVHSDRLLRQWRAPGRLGAVPGQRPGLREHGDAERWHGAARDHRAGGQLHGRGAVHRRRQLCRDPAGRRDQRHPHRQSGGDRHGRHPGYSHRHLWPVGHVHGHRLLRQWRRPPTARCSSWSTAWPTAAR